MTNQAHRTKKKWVFVLNGTGFAPTLSLVNWRISKKSQGTQTEVAELVMPRLLAENLGAVP